MQDLLFRSMARRKTGGRLGYPTGAPMYISTWDLPSWTIIKERVLKPVISMKEMKESSAISKLKGHILLMVSRGQKFGWAFTNYQICFLVSSLLIYSMLFTIVPMNLYFWVWSSININYKLVCFTYILQINLKIFGSYEWGPIASHPASCKPNSLFTYLANCPTFCT